MTRQPLNPGLLEIARCKFRIDTLEIRGGDALDVHGVHVLAVHDALQAAYELGYELGCRQALADKQDAVIAKQALWADEPLHSLVRCQGTKHRR